METFDLNRNLFRVFVEPARDASGFRVVVMVSESSDSFFDRLTHVVLFRSADDAEMVASRVKATRVLTLAWWSWMPSAASAFAALQANPVRAIETVARHAAMGSG